LARVDRRIDAKSGVSQRLPISVMETVISNAERRAFVNGNHTESTRINDIYSSLPSITGKLELEYEGEQAGAARIARELIRKASNEVFTERFSGIDFRPVLDHFREKTELLIGEMTAESEVAERFEEVPGLLDAAGSGRVILRVPGDHIAACELVLEGLHAQKKLERKEGKSAATYSRARGENPKRQQYYDDWTGGKVN